MDVAVDPIDGGDETKREQSSDRNSNLHTTTTAASFLTLSTTAVYEQAQAVEEPVNIPAKGQSQDASVNVFDAAVHPRAEDATAVPTSVPSLQSTAPSILTRTENPGFFPSSSVQTSEGDFVDASTALITDLTQVPNPLPVMPHPADAGGSGMKDAMKDQSAGRVDLTAQAQMIMAAAAPPAQLDDVTTQIAPAMQPDTDSSDEAYAESTTTSYLTSIQSEISRGVLENERLYPSYGQHDYGMPIDEAELSRMDLQHKKYEMVIGYKHFLAPISPTPHRILDLGTGTGIWALDVADMYPSAQVIGIDIAPIQPKWVASNCQFEIDDMEEEWTFKQDSFDFIHLRDPLYVVRNWPKLMEQCYTHTKPGGWCELACIYPVPMCDDGTMPPDSGFKVICDKFIEASYLFGAPADSSLRFAEYLQNAGFVDVAEHIFKVPSSPWPKDKRLKQIGALEMMNVVEGATAFGLRAFEKCFGWTREQTELVMVNFRRDVKNRHYHQYCQYFVVYGRKPPERYPDDYGI